MSEKTIIDVSVNGLQDAKQLNQELEKTDNIGKKASTSTMTLQKQIRLLKTEMANAEQGSQQYNQAMLKASQLQSRMRENNDLVRASMLEQGTLFKNVGGAIGGLTGAVSVAAGVMGLFGKQSDSVQQMILKVQSALAITQGFASFAASMDDIIDLFQAFKASSMTASTAAANGLKGVTGDVEKTTGAFEDLSKSSANAASNIGAGASVIDKQTESFKNQSKTIGEVSEKIKDITINNNKVSESYLKAREANLAYWQSQIDSGKTDSFSKQQLAKAEESVRLLKVQQEEEAKLTKEVTNTENAQKKLNDTQSTGSKSAIKEIGKQVLLMGGITVLIMGAIYAFSKLVELYNAGNERMEALIKRNTEWIKGAYKYTEAAQVIQNNLQAIEGKQDKVSKAQLKRIKEEMAAGNLNFYNEIKNLSAKELLQERYWTKYLTNIKNVAKLEALIKVNAENEAQKLIQEAKLRAIQSQYEIERKELAKTNPNLAKTITEGTNVYEKTLIKLVGLTGKDGKIAQNMLALRKQAIDQTFVWGEAEAAFNYSDKALKNFQKDNKIVVGSVGNIGVTGAAKTEKDSKIDTYREVETYKEKLLEFLAADKDYLATKEFETSNAYNKEMQFYSNDIYKKNIFEKIKFEKELQEAIQLDAIARQEALDENTMALKVENEEIDKKIAKYKELHDITMSDIQSRSDKETLNLFNKNQEISTLQKKADAEDDPKKKKAINTKIEAAVKEKQAIEEKIKSIEKEKDAENEKTKAYNENVKKREENDKQVNENAKETAEVQKTAAESIARTWELSMEKVVESLQMAGEAFSRIGDVFSAMGNLYQADMDATNSYYDDKQKAREIDLAEGKITQEQSNDISNKLEKERYKALKVNFEKQKKVQEAAVYLQTASGIAGVWAQSLSQFGPILGSILAATSTAALLMNAVAQIKTIRAQKLDAPVPIGSSSSTSSAAPAIPDQSGLITKEENLNTVLSASNSEKAVAIVKVSEINRVQSNVAVANNTTTF